MKASELPVLVADGRRIEYRWIEPRRADALPLVFLHEGLGSAALWRDFPDRLAERTGAGALVYSRYGFGGSEPLQEPRRSDYLHHEASITLPAVLETLGIERPVLIGHSDGATIALIHAAESPRPVRAIVLEAPHVFVEDVTIAGIERARAAYAEGQLREKLAPWHTDVDATFGGWTDVWLQPEFREWSIVRLIMRVACPTLVIQGENDPYGTAAQLETIARAVSGPVETMLLPGCGHAPHAEQPDVVLDAMTEFVNSPERRV